MKDTLTTEQWDTIRDALEQRASHCRDLAKEMLEIKSEVGKRLSFQFKHTSEKAQKLYDYLMEKGLI